MDASPSAHHDALIDLVELRVPVADARARLRPFSPDADPVVDLGRDHLLAVLRRFDRGELSSDEVVGWAESVHLRDDIGRPGHDEDLLNEMLLELSNPDLFGATADISDQVRARLEAP
jgi:hypothetical protein